MIRRRGQHTTTTTNDGLRPDSTLQQRYILLFIFATSLTLATALIHQPLSAVPFHKIFCFSRAASCLAATQVFASPSYTFWPCIRCGCAEHIKLPLSPCIVYCPDNKPFPEQVQIRRSGLVRVPPPILNTGNRGLISHVCCIASLAVGV
ncbi:uncharacterized protein LACBIDRAFT_305111 [Laccaria bicolor S238N-H82]|uniref:Predicted protein n=1 Tax=Laccaria bicolor (strain S238N-H82 / ATCC MYA-4686) TaxID=486041 RepID=B0CTF8_LACBS|nr:uncharacterized protein LACBIDRAFT_305111 [Laccaria bicolor S238N-H82]EDR13913.1 predicted protein [Laccaria bicolor S238N-H82]|eukprot:XP_001874472.1 predicted protein [Laccaria bicolor S238N-H82]